MLERPAAGTAALQLAGQFLGVSAAPADGGGRRRSLSFGRSPGAGSQPGKAAQLAPAERGLLGYKQKS